MYIISLQKLKKKKTDFIIIIVFLIMKKGVSQFSLLKISDIINLNST